MTKRFLAAAVGAAAALTLALPAAPASAYCISLFTTPVDCVKEAIGVTIKNPCPIEGTRPTCLPDGS
ncbi:MAG TPA: hypothetical protein VF519_15865 [Mycobacteriales bacterium]|jgi:hypothetical protein